MNPQTIWESEVNNLVLEAEKCSICGSSDVVTSVEFQLCSVSSPDTVGSAIGIVAALAIGVGLLREKYSTVTLELRLCEKCMDERTHNKELRISWQDYNMHPLCRLYKPMGYVNLRAKNKFKNINRLTDGKQTCSKHITTLLNVLYQGINRWEQGISSGYDSQISNWRGIWH